MQKYILRRIIEMIPLLFGIILINFLILHAAPGDPLSYLTATGEDISPEYRALLISRYGLDKPLHIQFLLYFSQILRGNLGVSYRWNQPVLHIILERAPATLMLMGTSFVLSVIIGVILGIRASLKAYSLGDNIIMSFSLIGFSIPVFWYALMMIIVFSLYLGWFPTQGMQTIIAEYTGLAHTLDVLKHLVLPVSTISVASIAGYARLTRASMLEVLRKDFITTAWSKGISSRKVYFKHAFKNAILPVITVVGLNMGSLLTGATLTESVFGWPGLGRLMFESIYTRDYPLLMGNMIIVSTLVVVSTLITDLLYSYFDPRVVLK